MVNYNPKYEECSLINNFNEREPEAFGVVYIAVFDEINRFANHLFYSTSVDTKDLIHDIFVNIWSNKSLKFLSLLHVRNYLYLAIKNRLKDYLKHDKHVNEYRKKMLQSEDYQFTQMVESSTLAILSESVSVLPEECAEVFRMSLEGWDINEIAEKIGKSKSSVYNLRNDAISRLKRMLNNKQLVFLLGFF